MSSFPGPGTSPTWTGRRSSRRRSRSFWRASSPATLAASSPAKAGDPVHTKRKARHLNRPRTRLWLLDAPLSRGMTPSVWLAQLLPRQFRSRAECRELGHRNIPAHRRHAAVGAGDDALLRHIARGLGDHCRDLLGTLDGVRRDVDRADEHVLAVEQLEETHRHPGIAALERDLADPAFCQRRKGLLVLAPLAAEARLPVDVRLDAVAVADVHRGGAGEPRDRAMQPLDGAVG